MRGSNKYNVRGLLKIHRSIFLPALVLFFAIPVLPNNSIYAGNSDYVKKDFLKNGNFLPDSLIYYKQGIQKASKGKFRQARKEFETALERDKYDSSTQGLLDILSDVDKRKISKKYAVFFFRGLVNSLNTDSYNLSIKNLKKAIIENPNYAAAHLMLGSIYYNLGQIRQAFVLWERALEADTDCIDARIYFGIAYQDLGRFREAENNLQKAKSLLQLKGDGEGVKKTLALLKILSQNNISFYYREGVRMACEGDFEEAEVQFRNALLIDRLDYESRSSLKTLSDLSEGKINQECAVHLFKGRDYLADGDYREAIKEIRVALEITPNYARGVSSLGSVYFISGHPEEAILYYEKAITIDPAYALAYYNLGVTHASLGQPQKAVPFYQKSIELDPEYAPAYNNLGIIYKNLGETQRAIAYYQKAIEIKPDFYQDPYFNLANAYSSLRNFQQAVSYYEKALDIEPFDALSYEGIAVAYYNSNQLKKSTHYYEKAIDLDRSNDKLCVGLGNAYERLKCPKQALFCYEKAVQINAESAEGYEGIARVKFSLGKIGEMRKNRRKAKEIYQFQGNSQKVKAIEDWVKTLP